METQASDLGLTLNRSKSEIICKSNSVKSKITHDLPNSKVVSLHEAELLGSPTGSESSMDSVLLCEVDQLKVTSGQLGLLHLQDALLLLRNSLAIPKLLYALWSAPCFGSNVLREFDHLLQTLLSSILNMNLSNTTVWSQATLLIKWGGIDIRQKYNPACTFCLFGFSYRCRHLVHKICGAFSLDPYPDQALKIWEDLSNQPPSPTPYRGVPSTKGLGCACCFCLL